MERFRPILRVAVPATLLAALVTWLLATPPQAARRTAAAPAGFRGDEAPRYGPPDSSFGGAGMASGFPDGPADGALRRALETTVNGQIAALKKQDYEAALRFATASFRQNYTPAQFGEMVARGFPEITASQSTTFRDIRRLAPEVAEIVVVATSKNGTAADYLYTLVREGGRWRVMSVLPGRRSAPLPGGRRTVNPRSAQAN